MDYPTNIHKCPLCKGDTFGASNVDFDPDWRDEVNRRLTPDKAEVAGEVSFQFEVGPDGVERIFLSMAELVRARLASSVLSLRLLAQTDPVGCPAGLPVLKVNGLLVEFQGYDESRRRWWVELIDVDTGEAVSYALVPYTGGNQ